MSADRRGAARRLLSLLAMVAPGCAPIATKDVSVVDVPMLFCGTGPAIEVMVNGAGPFLFYIDTGAQGFARADASLVPRLALRAVGTTAAGYASSEKHVALDEVRFETLA